MSIDLSQYEQAYDEQVVEDRGFSEVPDGKYQCRVESALLDRTRMSGDPILKWQLEILNGEFSGRYLFRNNLFGSPDNLRFLKADLSRCGLVLGKLSELPDRLGQLLDVEIEVQKKTTTKGDKEYSNVYIQKRLDGVKRTPKTGPKPDGIIPGDSGAPF